MNDGTDTLVDCTDGSFNFANMVVLWGNVQLTGKEIIFDAIEFMVTMNFRYEKPTTVVNSEDIGDVFQQRSLRTIT